MSSGDKIMYSCDVCGSRHQMGPGRYDGKFIPAYKMQVCMPCFKMNWDGWAPIHEPKVITHLNEKNIPIPARNAAGWLPRGM
ncbi:hypothetical protein DSM14862_00190 [Sulfitobacter indolifex]|nr:hypothetical protein DSM14862_00190 [Sulfitobacter indolifex]